MSSEFNEVYHHRLRYFLTPQFDMYGNVRALLEKEGRHLQILDYGCGNGVGSVLLKKNGWEVTGLDSDEEAIHFAADCWSHLCQFRHEDWAADGCPADNPFPKPENDAVVCLEVIEHVKDPHGLLLRLEHAARPGGLVVVSTLNHDSQYRKNRGHIGKFHLGGFRALCRDYLPGARICDYTMENELVEGSTITPMVAVYRKPEGVDV